MGCFSLPQFKGLEQEWLYRVGLVYP
jgi:hypothetical protein